MREGEKNKQGYNKKHGNHCVELQLSAKVMNFHTLKINFFQHFVVLYDIVRVMPLGFPLFPEYYSL